MKRPDIKVYVRSFGDGSPQIIKRVVVNGEDWVVMEADVHLGANDPVVVTLKLMPASLTVLPDEASGEK